MRNLKRALSLTLASVMLLGMMVVGSSAASYPDVEDTHNVEAIEVLQAIGVMVGDDNGNFGPDDQVNRAQMAVVMALLLDLDYDYYKGTNPFWDVPSWAEPYVAACYANGIVSGYNATTYGAGDPVTAVQAASMMMRALGYFQYQSDYKDGFELSTVKQASKISLFKDINAASNTTALTRNQVAQLALNTLESAIVDAKDNTLNISGESGGMSMSVTGGQVDYVVRTSSEPFAYTINWTDLGDTETSGRRGATVELGEQLFSGDLKKFTDGETDVMGRPATRWVYDNDEVGVYVNKSDLKFSFTAKAAKSEMYKNIGSAIANDLIANNGAGDGKYDFEVWVDGMELTGSDGTKSATGSNYFEKNNTAAAGVSNAIGKGGADSPIGVSGNGVVTEVFIVDDGGKIGTRTVDKVVIVMTDTYLVKATADYNSTKESVTVEPVEINTTKPVTTPTPKDESIVLPALKTTISNDDFNVANVKEGDYLLVTWSYSDNDYVTVKPAEVVTGNVSEYTVTDYVIVDGTKYSYNKLVGSPEKGQEFSINQDAKLVLDAYGYIIYVDEAISTNSFVYIQRVADPAGLGKSASAAAYFTDGTQEDIKVKEVFLKNGTKKTSGEWLANNANVHGWYTYIKTSDGDYSLTVADYKDLRVRDSVKNNAVADNTPTQIMFNNMVRFLKAPNNFAGNVDAAISAKSIRGNADTIFITLDDDDEITVSKGVANAPDVIIGGNTDDDDSVEANAAEINWVAKDGYAQYVFVDVSKCTGNVDSAVNAAEYLFILKNTKNKTVVDGDTYYKFKVVIDGEETERWIEQSNAVETGKLYYNVKTNSKDYITKATEVPNKSTQTSVDLVAANGDTVTANSKTMVIGKDSFIIDDAELNLVVGKDVPKPVKFNPGADYELYQNTTASTITGTIQKHNLTGAAYVILDENDKDKAEIVWIYISDAVEAAKPATIKTQPVGKELTEGYTPDGGALTVVAEDKDGGTTHLTYQWYKDDVKVDGATSASYTIPADLDVGTYVYYCAIKETDGTKVSTINTDEVEVVVKAKEPSPKPTITAKGDTAIHFKAEVGTTQTLEVNTPTFTGGATAGTLKYTWKDGSTDLNNDAASIDVKALTTGVHTVTCVVSNTADANHSATNSDAVTFTVVVFPKDAATLITGTAASIGATETDTSLIVAGYADLKTAGFTVTAAADTDATTAKIGSVRIDDDGKIYATGTTDGTDGAIKVTVSYKLNESTTWAEDYSKTGLTVAK